MMRSWMSICLLAAISLTMGAIWPDFSLAAQAPQLELLGQVKAGLRVPTRIAVDVAGNLYVADSRLQQIFKFDKFAQRQLIIDQEKISGAGLAVSPAGDRIYASSFDKVVVFSGDGELLGYLGRGAGEFETAGSITLDRMGTIYVADLGRGAVKCYRPDGTSAGNFGGATFVANSFLSVHPTTGTLYLPDSVIHSQGGLKPQIRVYDQAANLQQQLFADRAFGRSPVLFFGGMTFDNQGRSYVTDVEGKTIRILDENGVWLSTYDRNGELNRPGAMAFDEVTNRLFVVQADDQIDIYGVDGAKNPLVVNNVPEVPVPVAPIGGSEVAALRPTLRFTNAVDADAGDQLSYTVRVYDAGQNLVEELMANEQELTTSVLLTADLLENGFYRWQVQAFDGEAESGWSELQSFYVNALQEAPSVPILTSPLAGDTANSDAILAWLPASDADPSDTLTYLLEVAADVDFTELLYQEELATTERGVAGWSELIDPGQTCYWRITARDNHGLQTVSNDDGRFLFQASLLQVTANMPAARVYLGGNHGYAGQFIGVAPFEVRDLPQGRYQLVVERAGFEPFYQPIDIQLTAPTQIYAEMIPARSTKNLRFRPLEVAGKPVKTGSLLTPILADLDLDGLEDLLLGHANGRLQYHPGEQDQTNRQSKIVFQAEKILNTPQFAGGTPLVVDWNNDFQQDLLIGGADGSVWLFLNRGDFNFSEDPQLLVAVTSSAVPAVADVDFDGDKDLLVGSGDGELVLFSNLGVDGDPQLAGPQNLVTFAEAAAPSFADWDGDGWREMLIASEGQLYRGSYETGALNGLKLLPLEGIEVARIFAHDLNDTDGKELLVGTADGELLIGYTKRNRRYVTAFYPALTEKLQQLQGLVEQDAPELLGTLQSIIALAESQRIDRMKKRLDRFVAELPVDSVATACASELVKILQD